MKDKQNSITIMQYIIMIHSIQVGPGMLSLPKVLADKAGSDGWISILIGWMLSTLASILFIRIAQSVPHNSPRALFDNLFGKSIGWGISIVYALYFTLFYWIVLVKSMLFTKSWFLSNTADYVVVFLFCIPTYVLLNKGLQIVARYCDLIFYMTILWPFILLIPLSDGSWLHFLPVLKEGMTPILQAVPSLIYSYLGFEICFFLYPFLQQKKYAMHGVIIANTLTMLVYLFVTIVCFYIFSPDSIIQFTQPILNRNYSA
ncbi:GerAB/ArcD/ProY family transporter [Bacillus cereus]|nr:GerAB/ArcD/ProY family transporter [Bacillus cereus]